VLTGAWSITMFPAAWQGAFCFLLSGIWGATSQRNYPDNEALMYTPISNGYTCLSEHRCRRPAASPKKKSYPVDLTIGGA